MIQHTRYLNVEAWGSVGVGREALGWLCTLSPRPGWHLGASLCVSELLTGVLWLGLALSGGDLGGSHTGLGFLPRPASSEVQPKAWVPRCSIPGALSVPLPHSTPGLCLQLRDERKPKDKHLVVKSKAAGPALGSGRRVSELSAPLAEASALPPLCGQPPGLLEETPAR